MRKTDYKVGDKYWRLTIKQIVKLPVGNQGRKMKFVECLCDCGGKTTTTITSLRDGSSKSCGCLWKEKMTKHGMCGTKIYGTWTGIKERCNNSNNKRYKDYGGRGITYQKSWENFQNFYNDMYKSYLEHIKKYGEKNTSIDRINNNGNYCKENCRWATLEEQYNNTRKTIYLEYKGKVLSLKEISKKINIKTNTLSCRLRRGWSKERIFELLH